MSLVLATFLTAGSFAQDAPEPPPAEPVAEAAGPVTYQLDPAKSWIYVVVYNDPTTAAARFGHDHGVRAMEFDGTVVWDTSDPSACKIDISFPVTALWPDPPGMRERADLDPEGAVKEDAKQTIKDNFLKPGQLDGSAFPKIEYRSTSCDGTSGTVNVKGTLTIRGVGKAITVPMTVTADEGSFAAKGSFTATHGDFGFKPFTNLMGALRNKDELKFVVDVVGTPR